MAFVCCLKYRLNLGRGTWEKNPGEVGSENAGDSKVKASSKPSVKFLLAAVSHGHRQPKGTVHSQPGVGGGSAANRPTAGLFISGLTSVKWE